MLTQQQADSYHTNGYLAVEGVFTAEEVAELRRVTDEFVEKSRQLTENDEVFDLEPSHTAETPSLRRIKNPASHHPFYARLLRDKRILDIVEQLLGPGVRTNSNKLNMKSSGGGSAVEWHQDWAFIPHTNDSILTLGIAVDDITMENGPLLMIPGSHKGPIHSHHQNGMFVAAVTDAAFSLDDAVPIELKAGGVSVHHTRVLHASSPNTSGRGRRLLFYEYCANDTWPLAGIGDWDTFTSTILRGEPTLDLRLEAVPVRIPLPGLDRSESIFEIQTRLEKPVLGAEN